MHGQPHTRFKEFSFKSGQTRQYVNYFKMCFDARTVHLLQSVIQTN